MRLDSPRTSRARRRATALAAAAATVLLPLLGAAPAAAAPGSDDPYWYLTSQRVEEVAHSQGITGAGVTIAVIDSKIDPSNPDLVGTDLRVRDYRSCNAEGPGTWQSSQGPWSAATYHASNVASLVVGTGVGDGSGNGVRGVAPGATVLAYWVPLGGKDPDGNEVPAPGCEREGAAHPPLNPLALAVDTAVQDGADIINLSLGSDGIVNFGRDPLEAAVARAVHAGVLVVAASGNESTRVGTPADLNGVIAVGAYDHDGQRSEFSNYGPALTLAAPGSDIATRIPDGRYGTGRGTSSATPIVSAMLALTMQRWPDATPAQVVQSAIASPVGDPGRTDELGHGRIDLPTLMQQDPTAFPDVNPLVDDPGKEVEFPPSAEIERPWGFDLEAETEVDVYVTGLPLDRGSERGARAYDPDGQCTYSIATGLLEPESQVLCTDRRDYSAVVAGTAAIGEWVAVPGLFDDDPADAGDRDEQAEPATGLGAGAVVGIVAGVVVLVGALAAVVLVLRSRRRGEPDAQPEPVDASPEPTGPAPRS